MAARLGRDAESIPGGPFRRIERKRHDLGSLIKTSPNVQEEQYDSAGSD
ncbi:MAG: hypothetical protein HQL88_07105 [Magnetococcales bacterium]|nr:hypothetical protein [Magnetococcales bacterium]